MRKARSFSSVLLLGILISSLWAWSTASAAPYVSKIRFASGYGLFLPAFRPIPGFGDSPVGTGTQPSIMIDADIMYLETGPNVFGPFPTYSYPFLYSTENWTFPGNQAGTLAIGGGPVATRTAAMTGYVDGDSVQLCGGSAAMTGPLSSVGQGDCSGNRPPFGTGTATPAPINAVAINAHPGSNRFGGVVQLTGTDSHCSRIADFVGQGGGDMFNCTNYPMTPLFGAGWGSGFTTTGTFTNTLFGNTFMSTNVAWGQGPWTTGFQIGQGPSPGGYYASYFPRAVGIYGYTASGTDAAGYDNRTPSGNNGTIQLVSGFLGNVSIAGFPTGYKILASWTIEFVPEPSSTGMLATGLFALPMIYAVSRRRKER
jgi:hypothetical protein